MLPIPPKPPAAERQLFKATFSLANGKTVEGFFTDASDSEPDEAAKEFGNRLARPGWLRVGSLLVHTGAISAIEIDTA